MNTETTWPRIAHSVKETAAALRKELRATFPGVRFSVRMDRGTAYGWLSVSWEDGPTDEQVREITRGYQSESWSGMDECYHHIPPQLVMIDGVPTEVVWGSCGILTQRRLGEYGRQRGIEHLSRRHPEVDWESTACQPWADRLVGGEWLPEPLSYHSSPADIVQWWALQFDMSEEVA